MAENLDKWPSKRGPISKIRPSNDFRKDAVPQAVDQWYDFHEFGYHLGSVGSALPRLTLQVDQSAGQAIDTWESGVETIMQAA